MRKKTRRRTKGAPHRGTLRLLAVFALLLGANAYIFMFRRGTSVKDLIALSADHGMAEALIPAPPRDRAAARRAETRPPEAARAAAPAPVEPLDEGRVVTGSADSLSSLGALLARESVPPKTAADVTGALGRALDGKGAHATCALLFDGESRLRSVEWRPVDKIGARVDRVVAGGRESWRATREPAPLVTRVVSVSGVVVRSVGAAFERAGESITLARAFAAIFAGDLSLAAEAAAGDRFRLLVEKLYVGDRFLRDGRILAAEWTGATGTLRAYGFDPHAAPATATPQPTTARTATAAPTSDNFAYFDEAGDAVEKTLLRSPLRLPLRTPATDARRARPTLRTEAGRPGLSFAAPPGTPVQALAEGRVRLGPHGDDGETLTVTHAGGMETVYAHVTRLARGLEPGALVRQGQILGYLDATPRSPSPRLHLAVRLGGHIVDPRTLRPARAQPLPLGRRAEYRALVAVRAEQLDRAVRASAAPAIAHADDAP